MFTGLIEEVGSVAAIQRGAGSARLSIQAPTIAQDARVGDSVSISGACLTVVARDQSRLSFDAVPETMGRTTLGRLRTGDPVNLERALSVGQRLGGHFVQGHVDGTGTLLSIAAEGNARILRIGLASALMRYVAPKGSVAVDGISLTVVEADDDSFTVSIIPHTWDHTALRVRRPNDWMNVETDVLAKYVGRLLAARGSAGGVTYANLVEAGFAGD